MNNYFHNLSTVLGWIAVALVFGTLILGLYAFAIEVQKEQMRRQKERSKREPK